MVLVKNVVELGVKLARKYTIRAHGRKHPLSQLLTSELAKQGLTFATRGMASHVIYIGTHDRGTR